MASNGFGDKAELTRLVLEHMEDALRLATRLCGDPHQAEDVLQEALYRAARGWNSFRRESQFRTWLFRIVVNAFRDSLRTRRAWAPLTVDLPDDTPQQTTVLAAEELEERIAECIAALPARQREVVVLRIVEELPVSEVARVMETSEANVHATLHIARKRLKQHLTPYLDQVHRE